MEFYAAIKKSEVALYKNLGKCPCYIKANRKVAEQHDVYHKFYRKHM